MTIDDAVLMSFTWIVEGRLAAPTGKEQRPYSGLESCAVRREALRRSVDRGIGGPACVQTPFYRAVDRAVLPGGRIREPGVAGPPSDITMNTT